VDEKGKKKASLGGDLIGGQNKKPNTEAKKSPTTRISLYWGRTTRGAPVQPHACFSERRESGRTTIKGFGGGGGTAAAQRLGVSRCYRVDKGKGSAVGHKRPGKGGPRCEKANKEP